MSDIKICQMRIMTLEQRIAQDHAIIMGNKLAFGIGIASKDKQLKIAVEALEGAKLSVEHPYTTTK